MTTERKNYNLFIGKTIYGEYLFLDGAFKHDDGFKGLTGTTMEFLTEETANQRAEDFFNDREAIDYYTDYIKNTENKNATFYDRQDLVMSENPNGPLNDDSYCSQKWLLNTMDLVNEKEGTNYTISNCVGGGRCFNEDNIKKDYYEYVDDNNFKLLQKLYKEYEK